MSGPTPQQVQDAAHKLAKLAVWAIYDHPRDAPHAFVLRPQLISRGAIEPLAYAWYAASPEELRSILPFALHRLPRDPDDDPVILEVWI